MSDVTAQDARYLKRALRLAEKGLGRTFPNPMVGAVIVKNGRIVGEGYHRKAGEPHAEIEALRMAGKTAKGATLYVNLEPCSHHGKTPPCVDAVIEAKIKRVVCCTCDPNVIARGGIEKLRRAGIAASVGGCEAEARELNEAFFTFHEMRRPFVAIKFAASLDGKIATHTGDSKWITNGRARAYARALRGRYQCVLVGINTVIRDNPHLGARSKSIPDPLRIVLDSTLKIRLGCKVLRDTNVLIFTTRRANRKKYNQLIESGISIVRLESGVIPVKSIMRELRRRKIVSVFVEGGAGVLGSFVDAKRVDKVYVFQSPFIIGGEGARSAVGGRGVSLIRQALRLTRVTHEMFGDNVLVSGYLKK